MKKPEPVPGLVIRYDYLWRDEARRGRIEGSKVRPCAIVVARRLEENGQTTVLLAPITHSPPIDPGQAIELPPKVKRHLGLDDAPSWIVTAELNSANWDDPGIEPVNRARWAYGLLPPSLARALVDHVRERMHSAKLGVIKRK